MRYLLSVLFVITGFCLSGQDDFYIDKHGDSVKCEVKKAFPNEIKVKIEDKENVSLGADEIKGFKKDRIFFVSKEITNKKKKTFIFLPNHNGKTSYDRRFKVGARGWVDVDLTVRSGNGIRFYEITEKELNQNPPQFITTLYIDNDSLGLRSVPYLLPIGGSADKIDVINALYDYLRDNVEIEKRLSINEPWKTFNYDGVCKMIESYIGKKITD